MTTSQTGAGDPYATARSDMRDTTKWLASTFAAIAAVVVAGTPFASIGAMDWGDSRLHVAAGSVFLALAALMLAIAKTFTLLRSDGIFASDFAFDPNTTPRTLEEKELRDAARQINKHRSDLLPPEYDTVQELVEARQSVDKTLRTLEAEKPRDEAKIEEWKALLAPFDDPVTNVLYFAQYWRRYARIKQALPWLAVYAFAALVLLLRVCVGGKTSTAGTETSAVRGLRGP